MKAGRSFPVLQGILPLDRKRIPTDVIAGITLAALAIPEVMGYTHHRRHAGDHRPLHDPHPDRGLRAARLVAAPRRRRRLGDGGDHGRRPGRAWRPPARREYIALAGMLAIIAGGFLLLARLLQARLHRQLPLAHRAHRLPHRRRHPGRLRAVLAASSASPRAASGPVAAGRRHASRTSAATSAPRRWPSRPSCCCSSSVGGRRCPSDPLGADRRRRRDRRQRRARPRRRTESTTLGTGAQRPAARSAARASRSSDVRRAARHGGLDLRRRPGAERRHLARLRGEVLRPLRRERRPRRPRPRQRRPPA